MKQSRLRVKSSKVRKHWNYGRLQRFYYGIFQSCVCLSVILALHAIEERKAQWGYLLMELSCRYFTPLCALDAG